MLFYSSCKVMFYNKNLLHSEILLLRIKFTEYPLTIFFIHVTVRPLNENGTWQYKTEKEYLCIKDWKEKGFTASEFKTAQKQGWEKQYRYKVGKRKNI